jgi:exodeoxyribonuclease VII small subunit
MSKAAKGASPVAGPAEEIPFEQAIEKLEAIVEAMETGELTLEETLARFEEGTKLAKVCQAKLADAELKVSQLEKNSAGEFALKPVGSVE